MSTGMFAAHAGRLAAADGVPADHPAGRTSDGPFSALAHSKVMLCDDDPIMLVVVQTFLEEAGYTSFVVTSDPTQAMSLMISERPDVLLLDLVMPGMSGFDVLRSLRAEQELRYMPVIMLTAENEPKVKLEALELGATDFLTKPVDPSELRLRLRNALAFKAYQDRLADFDALTGLPNRKKFQAALSAALANGGRQDSHGCLVLHIDLDRFKQVNDTLGHRAGDLLLCAVAQELTSLLDDMQSVQGPAASDRNEIAVLSRVGGNGFIVLLPGLHNLKKVDDAPSVARRVHNALARPFVVDGREVYVTASVGIAVSPGDGQDAPALLKHAEMAMYRAKQRGRNTFAFFSGEMNAHAVERMMLENHLRHAVEREELLLVYQPKVDVMSGRITGAEALVRWRHPELGFIPPQRFIPIAEDTGLIVEIGQWVLRAACMQMKAWQQEGLPAVSLAVNVSGSQFKQRKVWHGVLGALKHSGIEPSSLILELTESILMENAEESLEMLREIKDTGVRLAVDDFGTGYSSLTYLSRFPIDELKVDRSFVKGLPHERESTAIVGAVIGMGRELGLKLVAEGVDKEDQLRFLQARRCHEYQGFLCSRPAPAAPFASLLRRRG